LPAHVGCGDDEDLMAHMVEGQQSVKEHQAAIGSLQIVLSEFGELLQLADGIMGKEPDRAGSERRQSAKMGGRVLAQQTVKHLEDAAFELLLLAIPLQRDVAAAGAQQHVRPRSQKSVAANLFSAFD